jgi:hypothetical protein
VQLVSRSGEKVKTCNRLVTRTNETVD